MIQQPTTFILGAGTSFELGLPLGNDLRTRIRSRLFANDRPEVSTYMSAAVGEPKEIERSLHRLALALDNEASIDSALRSLNNERAVQIIGRAFIAEQIARSEFDSANLRDVKGEGLSALNETALQQIVQLCLSNISTPEIASGGLLNLNFVVFNYDRWLEQVLYLALTTWKGMTSESAAAVIASLNIHHPYGRLPALPWEITTNNQPAHEFGGDVTQDFLSSSFASLQTMDDSVELGLDYRTAERLQESHQVIILGCAPHPSNFRLLGHIVSDGKRQKIVHRGQALYATAFGPPSQTRRMEELVGEWMFNMGGKFQRSWIKSVSAYKLLEEYGPDLKF